MKLTPFALFTLLTAMATIGCGSNPSSPDVEIARPTISSDPSGATLHGTFRGSAGTLRASRAGEDDLTVIVFDREGEEIGRVDVVNGQFTLRGLPEEFWVEFWDGDTRVGREYFEGVKPNQEIDVRLSYDGSTVTVMDVQRTGIDHQPGSGVELEGTASDIDEDGPPPFDGSLVVDGENVGVRNVQTSIRKGNRTFELGEIPDGAQVHVRGVYEEVDGEMWVFAHEIKIQDEEDDDTSGEKVTICHIPPGNPDNKKTITVGADAVAAHLAHGDYLGSCNP